MKKKLVAITIMVLMASCSKKNDIIESATTNPSFFRDAHLVITSIVASDANGKVQIKFTTVYEKNITKIELMSGDTPNYLCSIYESASDGGSTQSKTYTVTDSNPKGQTMYYMIRYSLANGDWVYTDILKFVRGK